jgi:hypothetical protein
MKTHLRLFLATLLFTGALAFAQDASLLGPPKGSQVALIRGCLLANYRYLLRKPLDALQKFAFR